MEWGERHPPTTLLSTVNSKSQRQLSASGTGTGEEEGLGPFPGVSLPAPASLPPFFLLSSRRDFPAAVGVLGMERRRPGNTGRAP